MPLTKLRSAGHALRRWSKGYMGSIEGFKNPRAPLQLARWMREAGFREARVEHLAGPYSMAVGTK